MIKRTLYFGNPTYLSLKLKQLIIKPLDELSLNKGEYKPIIKSIPIEDIGIIVIDHKQITITSALLEELLNNNCAVITCDSKHLPIGLLLPLVGNNIQNERFRHQIEASLPLKKQLWQQTIENKIANQYYLLKYSTGELHNNMKIWSESVRSGDTDNMEARAAAYYWKNIFPQYPDFIRCRDDGVPNNLLNYGYAILRAIVARALVGSGLLPTLGIHHHNRYNAYCLADDIMEPYRPFVDREVVDIINSGKSLDLTLENKAQLLRIPTIDVYINGKRSPLMVAVSQTTSSLVKCFNGDIKKILYPKISIDESL